MPEDFKYALTRVCLRTGRLTLPMRMLDLFPKEGSVRALDSLSGEELTLELVAPRGVAGLHDFFEQHQLDVNDELVIRPLDDGRYSLTPLPRTRSKPAPAELDIGSLVDQLMELATPLSEPEIRSMFPAASDVADLPKLLAADGRVEKLEGKWRAKVVPAPPSAEANPQGSTETSESEPQVSVRSYPQGVLFPGDAGLNSEQPDFADHALQNEARKALVAYGYRVEGMSHGQLMAYADLGRKNYTALIHIHPEGARLDWAALLARRRETGAVYLAVFGEHRDLIRISNPAEMARATLWSWEALSRVQVLTETVPVTPVELETHFQRDGLFEHGLERFEKMIAQRVAERGEFSAVLTRLSSMRSPAIFMLDDVTVDIELPRDKVLTILELLSQAPFHLVSRVDHGEFCLRASVPEALSHLSDYALSLRSHMPSRRSERVQGIQGDTDPESAMVASYGAFEEAVDVNGET